MAELDFDNFEGHGSGNRAARLAHVINLTGAACSVALVIGLGIWGYKLAVRDVNGVPVMRALSGPMRVAPDVPGGDIASHQGLSVNAVAAVGTAAAMPDQVILAPRPVDLTLEDTPGLAMTAPVVTEEVGAAAMDPARLPEPVAEARPETSTDAAVAQALADVLAEGTAPLSPLTEAPLAVTDAAPTGSAPSRSPRPQARPGSRDVQAPQALPTEVQSVVSAVPAEIDAGTLEIGTRLVQLGAFDDEAGARAEWSRLQAQFGDLMTEKSLVIQAAQSGGRTFYRLRAHGFAGEDDARRFCAALVAENAPCIPAAHR